MDYIQIDFKLAIVAAMPHCGSTDLAEMRGDGIKKEGIRRLSLLFGIFGMIVWLGFVLSEASPGDFTNPRVCLIIIAGFLISFFFAFGAVRGIAWVVEGFMTDRTI